MVLHLISCLKLNDPCLYKQTLTGSGVFNIKQIGSQSVVMWIVEWLADEKSFFEKKSRWMNWEFRETNNFRQRSRFKAFAEERSFHQNSSSSRRETVMKKGAFVLKYNKTF